MVASPHRQEAFAVAIVPANLDVRLIPPPARIDDPFRARAWAEATLHQLCPIATEPDRWRIEHALAAAGPLVGQHIAVRWGTGRNTEAWSGVVVGRCTSGFVAADKYRRFVSFVDLWARHAFLDEPNDAHLRVNAMLQLLHARMPKVVPGSVVRLDARG